MLAMVLSNFFRLNGKATSMAQGELLDALKARQKVFKNRFLEPGSKLTWVKGAVFEGLTFTNFSFSETRIANIIFTNCTFQDCLFLGTRINEVEFHGCKFEGCNFNKAKLQDVYAKPEQFEGAIQDDKHANVGVWFYQQLRSNYDNTSQREFYNSVELRFQTWRRKEEFYRRSKRPTRKAGFSAWLRWIAFWPAHARSRVYGALFGYGYSWGRLALTSAVAIVALSIYNGSVAEEAFRLPSQPTVSSTIYFTIATMITLGAFGYDPTTSLGFTVVLLNAIIGAILISALLGSLVGRLSR